MIKGLGWRRPPSDVADVGQGFPKPSSLLSIERGKAASDVSVAHQALLLRSFEATKQGWFWSVDHHGCLTYISEDVAGLLGDAPAAFAGRPLSDLFSPADIDEPGRRTLAFVLSKQSSFANIGVRASLGGEARYWTLAGTPQFDQSGCFLGYHGSALEITEQRISSENATQLAKYDALTGLPNRRCMAEVLGSCLAGGDYYHRPCSILLVDLDRFKHVNDRLGHPAGDAVLEQVAARLIRIVGDKEKVFRLGGDEFQGCCRTARTEESSPSSPPRS